MSITLVESTCQQCGGAFSVKAYLAGVQKFCSMTCKGLATRHRVQLTCPNCGKVFTTPPSQITLRGRKHCSRKCDMQARTREITEIFWSHVDKSGGPDACWIWTASLDRRGYGEIGINHRTTKAHRFSYELAHGPIKSSKLFVCHNCPGGDNPSCVNPAHLFLGTYLDNIADATRKGRMARKLDAERVTEIRRLHKAGKRGVSIAQQFGISPCTVSAIVLRRTWQHIE